MNVRLTGDNDNRRIFRLLATYFLLHLVIRVLVSPNLELDEAEQLVMTQQLSWGYGPQPPLYTWLQAGLFSLFGVSHFSLALLKNLLLFCTYILVYAAGRASGFSRQTAMAAMLSLFLLPQIVWESQRDLTHSVLATTLSAATLAVWFHLRKRTTTVNYILLGICWGLGLIAKYNYGIFLVSLLVASLTLAEYRRLLFKPGILLSAASAIAIVTPHAVWMFSNMALMLSSSGKFKMAAGSSYLGSVLTGTASLAMAIVSFAAVLLTVYGLIHYLDRRRYSFTSPDPVKPGETLLLRSMLVSLGICLLMVLVFRVTHFKDRWMQQILFFLPLALLPWMRHAFEREGGRGMRVLAMCFGIATLIGLGGRSFAAPSGVTRFNLPYHEIASKLKNEVTTADLVVTDRMLLGGNIRMAVPSARIAVPKAPVFNGLKPDRALILWGEDESPRIRGAFKEYLTRMFSSEDLDAAKCGTVQAPLLYMPDETMTVNYAVITRHSR